jgi:hypothetical protein
MSRNVETEAGLITDALASLYDDVFIDCVWTYLVTTLTRNPLSKAHNVLMEALCTINMGGDIDCSTYLVGEPIEMDAAVKSLFGNDAIRQAWFLIFSTLGPTDQKNMSG